MRKAVIVDRNDWNANANAMKKIFLILFIAVIGASINRQVSYASLSVSASVSSSSALRPRAGSAPELNGLQVFFKGQPVTEVVNGKKIKKYSIELMGTGFLSDSNVVVTSIQAFPVTIDHPQQATTTSFVSPTDLLVKFTPGTAPAAGMLTIKVVNADGAESNSVSLDVISLPSTLSIGSVSPQSGPVGTQLTLSGNGFTPIPPSNVIAIRFTPVGLQDHRFAGLFEGFFVSSLVDSGTLTFILPTWLTEPICPGFQFVCDPIASPPVTAGLYRISIINPNGMSNGVLFDVTSE